MTTYLFTWNPNEWPWVELPEAARRVASGQSQEDRWSTGTRKSGIQPDDRFFLLRQGAEPRGVIGSRTILSEVFQAPHFKDARAAQGDEANYARVRFEHLVDPEHEPDRVLDVRLLENTFPDVSVWRTQASGVEVPGHVVPPIGRLWEAALGMRHARLADDIEQPERFVEGAVRRVSVNAYERNPLARQACIEHWGARCAVCGFDFQATYGDVAEGYIHVHHLKPLADLGEGYEVDPVADLRPLCPNCHAVAHLKDPPFTPDELVAMIGHQRR
jgi:5-methylcytosine-specific restriction enzyme A